MKNKDFIISFKTVWVLVIVNFLVTGMGTIGKIQHWEYAQIFVVFGFMLLFSTFVIIVSDMVKNKIYNRTFWILSMVLMPLIAAIFYLIQRNRLIRLGQLFG